MMEDTNKLLLHVFKNQNLVPDDELKLYLKEPCLPYMSVPKIDILDWWKVYLIKYIVFY
jgi:hypothetical protein